jgi:hypothetical protein
MEDRTPVPSEYRNPSLLATPPQVKWIRDLLDKKDLLKSPKFFDAVNAMDAEEYDAYIEQMKRDVEGLTKQTASKWITALKALPYKPQDLSRASTGSATPPVEVIRGRTRVEYHEIETDRGTRRVGRIILPDGAQVTAGSYGLSTEDDDRFTNDVSFFKVWVGDRGGWSVQLYVSDDTSRVKLAFPTQLDMLKRIALDPAKASSTFGLEFGRCGVCGRGLTNDESRALGIGPVCRERI